MTIVIDYSGNSHLNHFLKSTLNYTMKFQHTIKLFFWQYNYQTFQTSTCTSGDLKFTS